MSPLFLSLSTLLFSILCLSSAAFPFNTSTGPFFSAGAAPTAAVVLVPVEGAATPPSLSRSCRVSFFSFKRYIADDTLLWPFSERARSGYFAYFLQNLSYDFAALVDTAKRSSFVWRVCHYHHPLACTTMPIHGLDPSSDLQQHPHVHPHAPFPSAPPSTRYSPAHRSPSAAPPRYEMPRHCAHGTAPRRTASWRPSRGWRRR